MTSLLLPSSLILVTKVHYTSTLACLWTTCINRGELWLLSLTSAFLEDFAFQIDNKQLKKGRRKIMPYTRGKGSQRKKFADTLKETV
uniref:Uncharacterized protein n=1 Tax=Tanacetum cinerariifolium TaxID=118510 RepID=A0A699SHH4_TANCI|nr:hypothetical protein [Tanacetum cinerariifolium]